MTKVNTSCYYQYAMTKQEWLQVRMSAEEKEELQRFAREEGVSMSELIRDAIILWKAMKTINIVYPHE